MATAIPSVNVNPTLDGQAVRLLPNGSVLLLVALSMNGAQRERQLVISGVPAAPTFTLDGQAIATPSAVLVALGGHLLQIAARRDAVFNDAATQALFVGP